MRRGIVPQQGSNVFQRHHRKILLLHSNTFFPALEYILHIYTKIDRKEVRIQKIEILHLLFFSDQ